MKRKISVTTGSRSEYGILRPVLKAISKSKKLELYLIVAGMHLSKEYGSTINEIRKDGFKIYSKVNMIPSNDTNFSMSVSLGKGVISFSKVFRKIKPDINLILGDRDEMLASALAASHMNIPNAHIHGGDKSQGGIDEYNRHAITKISNIHFPATKKSKDRIIKMGENPKYVFLTGSPSIDEILKSKITDKASLEKKYKTKFTGNEILLVQHPITTQSEQSGLEILNTLRAITKLENTTFAIAPNSDAGGRNMYLKLRNFANRYSFIHLYKNLPRSDYLGMLTNSGVLVGNSSSGMIEASYFRIPVVNIGSRQKDRERGKNVIDIPNGTTNSIYHVIKKSLKKKKISKIKKSPYGNRNASRKIVQHLEKIKLNKNIIQKRIAY